MTTAKLSTLQQFVVITGFIALVCSIVMGMQFYSSLSHDVIGQVTYVIAGALLTCLVVLSLSIALWAFKTGNPIMGTMLVFMWIILLSLEIFAEFGFLANQQEKRASAAARDSMQAKLAEEGVKSANAKLENLASFATVNSESLRGELASLQAELEGAQARLRNCPSNYKTKCINPANSDIVRIQKEMEPLESQLQGRLQYESAVAAKQAAGQELGNVLEGKGVESAMPAGYTWFHRMAPSISPENVQAGTSIIIAALLSLWSSFAGFIVLTMTGRHGHGHDQRHGYDPMTVQAMPPSPEGMGLTREEVLQLIHSSRVEPSPAQEKADPKI
jgi:hypothetical protein